jgi:hypothetical protein
MSWVLRDVEREWKNAKRQPCQHEDERSSAVNGRTIRNDAAAAVIDVKLACSLRGL